MKRALGICVGSSSISGAYLEKKGGAVFKIKDFNINHNGNPKKILNEILSLGDFDYLAATGRKFKDYLNCSKISEPEAVEIALKKLSYKAEALVSAGSENIIAYKINNKQEITTAFTGNKCASGTGEFFLQQIKRMGLTLEEAALFAEEGDPYRIAGRCSVFCKSDCIHALNKGIAKTNVLAGLCKMIADKILELIRKTEAKKILLIGGISNNKTVAEFLKAEYPDIFIPEENNCFEAIGAAFYALEKDTVNDKINFFIDGKSSFEILKPLKDYESYVDFKQMNLGRLNEGDVCVLGLDVGSTTTKAVLVRIKDKAILASEYLRTKGDPIQASKNCYESILRQGGDKAKIIGLGVTGSGRHIAAMHALTEGAINEITAHASATLYFDTEADVIFEIGGQDAKYTYLTNGVPSDYAMNEACSAGTGSFLEEAAGESLGVNYLDICQLALKAKHPPNFSDQCSAFISSDIKTALQEGISKEDIVAGLVYSICLNYLNRVKGARPIGKKIFMQGGVCYNKAVPIAMAALLNKKIITPPEPGLMGAFGVALEIINRLNLGLIEEKNFDLKELIERKIEYDSPFICKGGAEKCDRKCSINVLVIQNKKYPFGGACSKYYEIKTRASNEKNKNYVALRQKLVFEKYLAKDDEILVPKKNIKIGLCKSFFANTYYPLFYNFFKLLGFDVVLGDVADKDGVEARLAPFCFPVELAHGFAKNLIDKNVDYIFIPHIVEVTGDKNNFYNKTCVLAQAEPFYIKTTFQKQLREKNIKILSPLINLSKSKEEIFKAFIALSNELQFSKKEARRAFDKAFASLTNMFNEFKELGREALIDLDKNPNKFGIVLFGRPYNVFADEANLGIPQKFYSRNIITIPLDFLPTVELESYRHMYWGTGNQILKAARFVKNKKNLFGVYVTNFSCGPDSFLITYFRDIMGSKPSLTLELDSHSADAGITTRIEAAIDIFKSYLRLSDKIKEKEKTENFRKTIFISKNQIQNSDGQILNLQSEKVKVAIPNMGRYGSQAFAAAFNYFGINAEALPPYKLEDLNAGKSCSSCKECLPLILTAGSLTNYCENYKRSDETLLYFMAEGEGPCRFGQYKIFLEDLIEKRKIRNAAILSLTDEDSYGGLGTNFTIRGWTAITIGDVYQNIRNAALALAHNREFALEVIEVEWNKILNSLRNDSLNGIFKQLKKSALELRKIELKSDIKKAKKIFLTGEIFVRNDEFSKANLLDLLARKNFVAKIAPIGEYVYYSNFMARFEKDKKYSLKNQIVFILRDVIQKYIEYRVKKALNLSGLADEELLDMNKILKKGSQYISKHLAGEAILTVGASLKQIEKDVCGVISIGPFGCMPSRVSESILNAAFADGKNCNSEISPMPFLTLETDGGPFSQLVESKIEIFMLQAERRHNYKYSTNKEFLYINIKEDLDLLTKKVANKTTKTTTD